MTGGDNLKSRAAYSREGRKQLFAVLQSARGSSGDCPFEYVYMLEHNVYMFFNIFIGKEKAPSICVRLTCGYVCLCEMFSQNLVNGLYYWS